MGAYHHSHTNLWNNGVEDVVLGDSLVWARLFRLEVAAPKAI